MTDARPPAAPVARAASGAPAAIGRRVAAFAIDLGVALGFAIVVGGIIFGVLVAVGSAWKPESLAIASGVGFAVVGVLSIAWMLVYTKMQASERGSIGQRVIGVRITDAESGAPVGFGRALLRNVVLGISGGIVVGYFSPLFDSSGRRQGWHDRAAHAVVVDRAADAVVTPPAPPVGKPVLATPVGLPVPSMPEGALGAPPLATPPPATGRFDPRPGQGTGGLISSIPGFAPTSAASAPPVVPPAASPAPVPPAAVSAQPAPPAPASAPEVDDDLDATRVGRSVAALTSLTWDDGTRVGVYGRTLFGRNPAGEDGTVVVAVRDETLSLSKTHFEVDGDASGVWVIDRHSTNGTVLVRDDTRQPLTPGDRTMLRAGDRLEFGDRSLTVGDAT